MAKVSRHSQELSASPERQARGRSWQRWLAAGADLLFPQVCIHCQREINVATDAILLCGPCRQAFEDSRPVCPVCGAGLPENSPVDESCLHCRGSRFKFSKVVALGDYSGSLKPAILLAKHSINVALAMHLGRLLAERRHTELHNLEADAVVAVPSFWTRRSKHGHNSAEVLSSEVARRLRLPVAENLLIRTRATRPQTELTPPERRANVRGAFSVRRHPDLPGARLLLVDDVLTTGSTASESSKALLKAGAAAVVVAVLARAVGDRP